MRWLEREDDAAAVALGGRWETPTVEDWEVLFDTNNFTISFDPDQRGVKFTSKIPSYEGRSIFLPLAGARGHDYLAEFEDEALGYYWSLELSNDDTTYARAAVILRSESGYLPKMSRSFGMPVRPICY